MKKTINLILGLFLCVFLVSCGQTSVADLVADANKELAGTTEDGITFESVTLEGKDIVFKCKILEFNFSDLGGVEVFEQLIKEELDASAIKSELLGEGEQAEEEMKIIIDEGCNIVYKFVDSNGETAKLRISNADLKAAL